MFITEKSMFSTEKSNIYETSKESTLNWLDNVEKIGVRNTKNLFVEHCVMNSIMNTTDDKQTTKRDTSEWTLKYRFREQLRLLQKTF